jgi:phage virion morphogenesis protein
MSTLIEIQITGGQVIDQLEKVRAALQNTAPLMSRISLVLLAQTEQAFAKGGVPAWHPLSARTIKDRTKRGTWPGQILQDSGQLAASITPSSGADFAQISTNKAYAAIQQFGGVIHHNAYSIKQNLRTDAKGNLLRQGKDGKAKNLAVFAKAGHKRVTERVAEHPAHDSMIPARPFMPVDADGSLTQPALTAVLAAFDDFFQNA